MTKGEKITFILEVMPKVSRIIKFASDEQIDNLYLQARQKFDSMLIEACY